MSSTSVNPVVPDPNTDPYGYLGMIRNPDGSVTRKLGFTLPTCPAAPDPANPTPVLSKDIPINQENQTWARIYLPRPEPATKLPLLIYIHGGGFIGCSAATTMFHKSCCDIAVQIPAVIVSVEYRLAPEHRLPAAYEDCVEVLHWIKTNTDEWLINYADFSKCFIMGGSAGGNIAYHVGLRVAEYVDQLVPLKIQGLILDQPFFGGVERTPSEIRLANDKVLPLSVSDVMWDLGLPVGTNRDHEYCNPMRITRLELFDRMRDLGWKFMVICSYGDPLVHRQIDYAKMLREKGLDVIKFSDEEGCHGFELFDESKANSVYGAIKNFIFAL